MHKWEHLYELNRKGVRESRAEPWLPEPLGFGLAWLCSGPGGADGEEGR